MTNRVLYLESQEKMNCKNHPKRETNVSCSNCGQGLCPECMVYTPVGIKCRECASPSRGMLRQGYYSQYIGAALAGLSASFIAGLVLFSIRISSFIIAIVAGLLIGEAVRRGARGNRGPVFTVIAAVSALVGLLISVLFMGRFGLSPVSIVYILIIAGIAAYRLNG